MLASSTGGRAIARGSVFTREGALVASVVQVMRIRVAVDEDAGLSS